MQAVTQATDTAIRYARSNHQRFVDELIDLLRIPSVSTYKTEASDRANVIRAAEWVRDRLQKIGLSDARLLETGGYPLVFGSWMGAPGAPTILIYGHYDVQPAEAETLSKWHSNPFEPTIRDEAIYARGACDDKGQVCVNLDAIEALMHAHNGSLPFNVKFMIEGEEEVMSENLEAFVKNNKDLLAADVCVISDTDVLGLDRPSVVYGLRGITYVEVRVTGPKKDLHSGQFGGAVHNPVQVLCEMLASLHNTDGSVNIPGFYDSVRPVSAEERESLAALEPSESEWDEQTGLTTAQAIGGEYGLSIRERVGARPTLEINGIIGGFTGEGSKTVLPAEAMAKVSCRLVSDQDPVAITKLLQDHIASITPPSVTSTVKLLSLGHPAILPLESAAMQAVTRAYEAGYGKKPVFLREGGSIPVVATLQAELGLPTVLAGYALPEDGAHGPNEKFNLESLYRGIETSITLFTELSQIPATDLKL